ncbi:hypothetical protein NA56DRAFT_651001 [Hyaloscypha hepaticicola]|uniref:S-adenosyl-L-methionine-dependent methyltransferase n=1 Tax=Hyaloscypha hepaticicola TaxID=2082293 RepID=A0A2J6PK61_9HELO|nr:hypothetical protein NA56DRAFT_651001 [Hyaloscypha hepaticicola]
MGSVSQRDRYPLGRDVSDSIRLDAQHLLWRMHLGYILHPQIPITKGMKIAELGTGTGVWILDAARCLPSTVELHGYDISNYQYPPRKFWPRNVTMGILDSLTDPPPQLVGQYDVVHLRMWASNLKGNDTSPLLEHVKKLLKPGGYVQWEDADLVNQAVSGEEAEKFAALMQEIFEKAGLQYEWVSELPARLPGHGFEVLHAGNTKFNYGCVQLCTNTYLMAMAEILRGVQRNSVANKSPITVRDQEEVLSKLLQNSRNGMVYNWIPVVVLGQKKENA